MIKQFVNIDMFSVTLVIVLWCKLPMVNTNFVAWLLAEMSARGWSNSELARRAGIAASMVSTVISQKKNPGVDFCSGIARALGEPPERVFRLAGLLPPPLVADPVVQEFVELLRGLSRENQAEVLAYVRYRHWLQQQERK